VPPFGTLFLQPGTQLALPRTVIPPATGTGVVHVGGPPTPHLVGMTLASQTLFVDFGGRGARLSGFAADRIFP
jgi:hypothetical protein